MAMLEVKDLEVNYGMIKAIKGVSFEVNEGEFHSRGRKIPVLHFSFHKICSFCVHGFSRIILYVFFT